MQIRHYASLVALVMLLAGCAAVGPPRVERDRIEYNASITESWKRQILLNVVKIRYVEPIFFMDVGEVVASYSMETGGTVGASRTIHDASAASDFSMFELGGSAKYTDRPTVTYRPLTGSAFFRGIMSPVPLKNVLSSIESGASAEFVLNLGLRSINGFRNETLSANGAQPADPEFIRAIELLAALQRDNALHVMRKPTLPGQLPELFLKIESNRKSERVTAVHRELREVLGLEETPNAYPIGFGSIAGNGQTIMLQTFSLAQMLAAVAARLDAPGEDIANHKAIPGRNTGNSGPFDRIMVHSSPTKPPNAFVSVEYRGNWFWVDDHDLVTKRVFSFIMLAFTLMDKGEQDSQLQLTVPTQ